MNIQVTDNRLIDSGEILEDILCFFTEFDKGHNVE